MYKSKDFSNTSNIMYISCLGYIKFQTEGTIRSMTTLPDTHAILGLGLSLIP